MLSILVANAFVFMKIFLFYFDVAMMLSHVMCTAIITMYIEIFSFLKNMSGHHAWETAIRSFQVITHISERFPDAVSS